MKLVRFSTIIFLQLYLLISQPVPNDHLLSQSTKLFFDTGLNWESLTNYGPIRFKLNDKKERLNYDSSFHVKGRIGLISYNDVISIYGSSFFKFRNNFYAYIFPEYTSEIQYNQDGIKSGFKNLKENISGIGFQNEWFLLQFGKGKENWGAGDNIELALSDDSKSYDYLLLASNYGKVRVKYVHGFLESIDENINRYITARGLEWTNKKTLIIGFSETIVYSGPNRFVDIGYINPISSHLEVELNNRLNIPGEGSANAVWQIHLDWYLNNHFRLSGNYLYDEFVLDPEIELEKEHGKAYSLRFAYTPIFSSNHLLTFYSKMIYIGTPTFRHGAGANNFVQDSRPLGWNKGSDGEEISIGFNYFNRQNLIISSSIGFFESGEENIIYRSYEKYSDYLRGPFPSGKVKNTFYIDNNFSFWWKKYLTISVGLQWSKIVENNISMDLRSNISFFHLFSSSL